MSSPSVSSLESLDNKTLRAKCLEYGLPNVPITDTSKKLLIRKLIVAMEAEKNPKLKDSAKARRETISVVTTKKPTTTASVNLENDKKAARRTTMGPVRANESPLKTIVVEPPVVAAPINNRRRSSRVTPSRQEPTITIEAKRVANEGVIIEEQDFEEDFILIDDDSHHSTHLATEKRKSVSPSILNVMPVPMPTKPVYNKSTPVVDPIPEVEYQVPTSLHGLPKPLLSSFIPSRGAEVYQSRYSKPLSFSRASAEKEPFPTGYKSIYPTLNTAAELTSYSFGAGQTGSTVTNAQSITNRRVSSGIYQQPITTYQTKRHVQSHYAENSDSNGEEDNVSIEEQAPYLSDFARRLTRLKAEPLNIGFNKESSKTRDVSRGSYGITGRGTSVTRTASVGESLKEFWIALDQKYKIKRNFFFIVVLSAIILAMYYYLI